MSVSLVLPCFDEEGNIEHTVREACTWLATANVQGEIIVVNDGSTDATASVLSRLQRECPELHVIHHERNRGYGAAILTGCDAAKSDIIAIVDSDGQFHIEDLGLLLPALEEVDFVAGRRARRADPLIRSLNAKLYGWLVRIVLGFSVRDINCGMKVFRRSLWTTIRPEHASGALFFAEMFLRLSREKVPWRQVAVPHYPRTIGKPTGAKPSVIFRMFRELLKLRRMCITSTPVASREGSAVHTSRIGDPRF